MHHFPRKTHHSLLELTHTSQHFGTTLGGGSLKSPTRQPESTCKNKDHLLSRLQWLLILLRMKSSHHPMTCRPREMGFCPFCPPSHRFLPALSALAPLVIVLFLEPTRRVPSPQAFLSVRCTCFPVQPHTHTHLPRLLQASGSTSPHRRAHPDRSA